MKSPARGEYIIIITKAISIKLELWFSEHVCPLGVLASAFYITEHIVDVSGNKKKTVQVECLNKGPQSVGCLFAFSNRIPPTLYRAEKWSRNGSTLRAIFRFDKPNTITRTRRNAGCVFIFLCICVTQMRYHHGGANGWLRVICVKCVYLTCDQVAWTKLCSGAGMMMFMGRVSRLWLNIYIYTSI